MNFKIPVKSTVYPLDYDKNAVPGTPRFVNAYNRWARYIQAENADNHMVYEAKKILERIR